MLTPEQIVAFKRDGFVILPKFIPESQLGTWVSRAHSRPPSACPASWLWLAPELTLGWPRPAD
jgi:hypothetical protein